MTDTLVADGDDNEKPEKATGLAKAFQRWVDDFRAELKAREDVQGLDSNVQFVEDIEREQVLLTQPFAGDEYDLDDDDIGERLWGAAWERATAEAEAAGKSNVAFLTLQGVGRSLFDGEWMNAATWAYIRW